MKYKNNLTYYFHNVFIIDCFKRIIFVLDMAHDAWRK